MVVEWCAVENPDLVRVEVDRHVAVPQICMHESWSRRPALGLKRPQQPSDYKLEQALAEHGEFFVRPLHRLHLGRIFVPCPLRSIPPSSFSWESTTVCCRHGSPVGIRTRRWAKCSPYAARAGGSVSSATSGSTSPDISHDWPSARHEKGFKYFS